MLVNMVVICMFSGIYNTRLEYRENSLFINSYMTHSTCMECVLGDLDCAEIEKITKCYCIELW